MSQLSVAVRRLRQRRRAGPAGRDCPPPRITGRVQCIRLPEYSLYVDMTDELVGACIARGGYEPHVTRAIAAALRPGDTFVDLGSNIGYYSLLAAAVVGPSGSVIGFEARPDNVHLARLSVRENGFRNVTLHNLAVSDRNSTLTMYAPEHTSLSKVVAGTAPVGEPFPFATAGEVVAYQQSLGDPRIHVDLVGRCD